jgi:hypothetical protein
MSKNEYEIKAKMLLVAYQETGRKAFIDRLKALRKKVYGF